MIFNFIFYINLRSLSEIENFEDAKSYSSKGEGMWPQVTVVNVVWVKSVSDKWIIYIVANQVCMFTLNFISWISRLEENKSGKLKVMWLEKTDL